MNVLLFHGSHYFMQNIINLFIYFFFSCNKYFIAENIFYKFADIYDQKSFNIRFL